MGRKKKRLNSSDYLKIHNFFFQRGENRKKKEGKKEIKE